MPIERVLKEPVEPVISKNPVSEEAGTEADVHEKDVLYGKDSPLRDDAVVDAWANAREAQKRLDDHRVYMDKVLKARKIKEAAKKADIEDKD